MNKNFFAALALSLGMAALAHAQNPAPAATPTPAETLDLPPEAAAAMRSIDPERIRAHVRFLSDDLLEGRGTGTRGGELAAKYIATQFALYGLKPAGDHGSYFQKVNFVGVQTEPDTTFALQPAQGDAIPLKAGDDYVTNNATRAAVTDLDAPIVFVGYGIKAPEWNWDDYKGVDVRGKVLLMIVNEPTSDDPKFFNGPALTYYGRWTYKYEEAARRGAIGALIIHRTDLASYPWDVVKSSWSNEQVYLADDPSPQLEAASWIQLDVARLLFTASGLDLDQEFAAANTREFKPVELPVHLVAHIVSKVRRFQSSNVLGIVPGAEAGAPKRAMIYTAHYDHLGMDPNLPGDSIYNGAVDNATGCGILLELARAYARAAQPPPQPVLFAAVTAEEKGLLGSLYLGRHLPFPPARVALDLNYDAVPPIGDPQSVTVTGAERTTFYPVVERTAQAFGLAIEPDAQPGAGHYYRSDHFSFAREGVPAFSINTGIKFAGHPPEWGKAQEDDYVAHRYHRPSDEYRPDMDFTADAKLASFGFALGWQAMAADRTIGWQAGDEFEAARRRSEKSP